MMKLYLGAHMSIAGGLYRAVERAVEVESDALQVFVKNASQWKAKARSERDVDRFCSAVSDSGLSSVVAHGSYLVNLATPDQGLWLKSIDALQDEMDRCENLQIRNLVIHPGSHSGSGESGGIKRIAEAINRLHDRNSKKRVQITLETTAGQGSSIGYRLEHFRDILSQLLDSERVKICLDTCHIFAAGYDFRKRGDFVALKKKFDRIIGLQKLAVIHLNDSKKVLGSRVDRHQHIGEGEIGLNGFRHFMKEPLFRKIPKILETPKGDDLENDRMNLSVLRGLADG